MARLVFGDGRSRFTCDALMDPKFKVGLLLAPERRDALTAVMVAVVGHPLHAFLSRIGVRASLGDGAGCSVTSRRGETEGES